MLKDSLCFPNAHAVRHFLQNLFRCFKFSSIFTFSICLFLHFCLATPEPLADGSNTAFRYFRGELKVTKGPGNPHSLKLLRLDASSRVIAPRCSAKLASTTMSVISVKFYGYSQCHQKSEFTTSFLIRSAMQKER